MLRTSRQGGHHHQLTLGILGIVGHQPLTFSRIVDLCINFSKRFVTEIRLRDGFFQFSGREKQQTNGNHLWVRIVTTSKRFPDFLMTNHQGKSIVESPKQRIQFRRWPARAPHLLKTALDAIQNLV